MIIYVFEGLENFHVRYNSFTHKVEFKTKLGYNWNFTSDNLQTFIKDVVSGKLRQVYKSENTADFQFSELVKEMYIK